MSTQNSAMVRVWDLPTRVFHWSLALSFFGAYLLAESDSARHLHVMFGYTVLALTVFRIAWGFIGTRYARFSSFAFGPRAVSTHLRRLARREMQEHPGHTPAGSWAIWLMLSLALVTAASGYLHLNSVGGEAMEEVHEVAANAWLLIVFIHVAGVIVSSVVERQNLPRAMVTGYKTLANRPERIRNVSVVGVVILAGIAAFWGATILSGGSLLLPEDSEATHESSRHLSSHERSDDD